MTKESKFQKGGLYGNDRETLPFFKLVDLSSTSILQQKTGKISFQSTTLSMICNKFSTPWCPSTFFEDGDGLIATKPEKP